MQRNANGSLDFIHIGNFRIMEPSTAISSEIQSLGEQHLRSSFKPATYVGRHDCNAILKSMFDFYERSLEALLPKIATCWWIGSIIYLYEQSGKISNAYKLNILSQEDSTYWRKHGAVFRQALDFLLEKLCSLHEIDLIEGSMEEQIPDFERALACAKQCVEYCSVSNLTHMVFSDDTIIKINPTSKHPFLEHSLPEHIHNVMVNHQIQNNKESSIRDKYMKGSPDPFDLEIHLQFLDKPFKEEFNISYAQFQAIILSIIDSIQEIKYPGNAPMSLKHALYEGISEYLQIDTSHISRIMHTVILDKSIPREIWNSRQFNRLSKRPILEFKSGERTVLTYSKIKLKEFLALLDTDLAFNKRPETWKSKKLNKAVSELSNNTGTWFERCVENQLTQLGFVGRAINNNSLNRLKEINFDCGQIDYLGYNSRINCLTILEFKMVDTGFEARSIRQVKSYFLDGDDSFAKLFTKKIAWVKSNLPSLSVYFKQEFKVEIPIVPDNLKPAFITYYPTVVDLFFSEIPCRSLIQFVDEFRENNSWHY